MTKKSRIFKLVAVVLALVMTLGMMSMLLAACGAKATVTLDQTELTTYVGDTVTLRATVEGDDDAEVEWSTSDSKVATVKKGRVTAVAKGKTTITATIESGASATCEVTVDERTVTIDKTTATINLDEEETLQLNATSSDGGAVSWTSSDPSKATVNSTGLVKGLDITEEDDPVIITASKGSAQATCAVTIISPNRPADYHKITKETNANVIANPGIWYYHADGSRGGDYEFASEPIHQNSTASATLTTIPNPSNNQFFYFRYQPDQVEVGQYYTMTLKITISEDATLRVGSIVADGKFGGIQPEMKAGVTQEVVYIGYRNTSEPLSVRINTPINADEVTLSVELVSVVPHDGTNLPDYHEHEKGPEMEYTEVETDPSEYLLESKGNSAVYSSDPGTWYYWPGDGSSVVTENTKYSNGTITFAFNTLTSSSSSNNQLRYKPDVELNTPIRLTFDVTVNVNASVVIQLTDASDFKSSSYKSNSVTADSKTSIVWETTFVDNKIISIQVNASGGENKNDVVFTFSDIKLYTGELVEAPEGPGGEDPDEPDEPEVPETPDYDNYTLNPGGNGDGSGTNVCAKPGIWAYMAVVPGGSTFAESTTLVKAAMEDGTLTWSMSKTEASEYYLRYRPLLSDGAVYKIAFDLTINRTGSGEGNQYISVSDKDGNGTKKYDTTDGEVVKVEYSTTLTSGNFFQIKLRILDASEQSPVTIVLNNIEVTDVTPEPVEPDNSTYTVQGGGSKSTVCGNPGVWYYMVDTESGTTIESTTVVTKAEMENGTLTWTLTKMEAKGYYLRYQPDLEEGTSYKISFDVVLNRTGSDTVKPRSEGGSKQYVTKGTTSGETLHIDFSDTVYSSEPFQILLNVADASDDNPVTITISNIIVTAL